MEFNRDLANRFVSDYSLPFPITFKEEFFNYYLDLFASHYHARTKYSKLAEVVDEKFDGDASKFLAEYYRVREEMIQTTLSNPSYQEFNNADLNKYAVKDRPQVTANNIYNGERIGGVYAIIDLRKANFQALKFVNPSIVNGAQTYEEFVGQFTDLEYIKESKYTRQVVFGQLNPKRQITVERYLTNEVRKIVLDWANLISMGNDELVYEVVDKSVVNEENFSLLSDRIKNKCREKLGVEVHVEFFTLCGYQLCYRDSGHVSKTFFQKIFMNSFEKELKSVPLPFFPIVWRLMRNEEPTEMDRHFNYEGMDAIINENFVVRELSNGIL
ncbi:MAG: hypothetical protein LUD72_04100 [Bacteroidales bacterium]|nr:hypothetical protein [Bacteroidales bacterium]